MSKMTSGSKLEYLSKYYDSKSKPKSKTPTFPSKSPSSQHVQEKETKSNPLILSNDRTRRRRYDSDDDDDDNNNDHTHSHTHSHPKDQNPTKNKSSATDFDFPKHSKSKKRYDSDDENEDNNVVHNSIPSPIQSSLHKQTLSLTRQEQLDLNQGRAQKLAQIERKVELQQLQQSSTLWVGQSQHDMNQNESFRYRSRVGDPMMSCSTMTRRMTTTTTSRNGETTTINRTVLQEYKGPPAKPNRYQIPPGYRWDGIDRGNGFEDLYLSKITSQSYEQEELYKKSCADM